MDMKKNCFHMKAITDWGPEKEISRSKISRKYEKTSNECKNCPIR